MFQLFQTEAETSLSVKLRESQIWLSVSPGLDRLDWDIRDPETSMELKTSSSLDMKKKILVLYHGAKKRRLGLGLGLRNVNF